ncbi:MAG: RHS repeat-associated core domain-containing protein [Hyphomicrobiaceae bacterium]
MTTHLQGQFDGAVTVADRSYGRGDALNLTSVTDLLIALPTRVPRAGRKRGLARPAHRNAANSQTFGYSAANRLNAASGPYGSYSWTYDLVGNRTSEGKTPPGGLLATDTYAYPATSNRIQTVTRAAATVRTLTYDNAGNILTDNGLAGSKTYTYNKRNRLGTATVGALGYAYTYNALEQLAIRQQTAGPSPFLTHFVHDIFGNVIAETAGGGATGTTGTVREYIWLPETEIAPTASTHTTIDRPLAVVDAVNTVSPQTWWVSVDHLNRPVRMTTAAKASVWDAVWQPWGGVQAITGSASLDARFPGQWFQAETGLHYNWHRSYDPTLGRYTQPDPLGFVDGPSVFGYAKGSPGQLEDHEGTSTDGFAKCYWLKLQTKTFCKWLPTTATCKGGPGGDSCAVIAAKIATANKCIIFQKAFSESCFNPEDQSHEQREYDEGQRIKKCINIAKSKRCPFCNLSPYDTDRLTPINPSE